MIFACSKVDEQVEKEDGVRHTVEDDPSRAVVVVEKRYCYRQNDEIRDQQHQHTTVPVKPAADISQHLKLKSNVFQAQRSIERNNQQDVSDTKAELYSDKRQQIRAEKKQ